ncbi:MAG: 16S rRNA (adenine(1518)-N(6)/adenine(1519)-N(6))-dimethyltransferase RsmA [Thermovirgaceae bacterium]|nr:16S rRNA (adenine(1518)-N(6)/adenine(1519)-N(6))-dimethyltransferase RsmA [Thermovirgaceae bacterium]
MAEIYHRANTKIGQNFLIDQNILKDILRHASIGPDDTILEVGAGKGVLTKGILENGPKTLYALEIDRSLEPYLASLSERYENLRLFWGDALRGGFPGSFDPVPNKMVANIPYHITTPLIWKVLESLAGYGLNYLLLMVQKEAAVRICAPARCKDRYPLGVTILSMGEAQILRLVPPEAFRPSPSVTSALLEIRITGNYALPNSPSWRSLIRSGFSQRRKTLANNLTRNFPEIREGILQLLGSLGLPPLVRAEELEIGQWKDLHKGFDTLDKTKKGRQP